MTRIENSIGASLPDVEGCLDGHQFWVELKVAKRPVRPTTPVRTQEPVKQGQIDWLTTRWNAGGNAWLLVQVGERHDAKRYLFRATDAKWIRDGIEEEYMGRLSVVPGESDAMAILQRMTYRY